MGGKIAKVIRRQIKKDVQQSLAIVRTWVNMQGFRVRARIAWAILRKKWL